MIPFRERTIARHLITVTAAAILALATVDAGAVPVALRTESTSYTIDADGDGEVLNGDRLGTRTEVRDAKGRLIRWETTSDSAGDRVVWMASFSGDRLIPDRACYWLGGLLHPEIEHFVASPDGTFADVLYASPDAKPLREMRVYFDPAGREIYQEYFDPKTQRRYSEESFTYDESGNETGRVWRRLDGRASKTTGFDVLESDDHGRWTRRLVTVNGLHAWIETRTIANGNTSRPRPERASGPVERRTEILPIPFAPGVISTESSGENMISFAAKGNIAVFGRYDDWASQVPLIANRRDYRWSDPDPLPFADTIYNAAIAADGRTIVYCVREEAGGRIFLTRLVRPRPANWADMWSAPVDLTESSGIRGSYFDLLPDNTLLYHHEGDLYRAILFDDSIEEAEPLPPPINTPDAVEFAPSLDGDRLLFTRSIEGDDERSGVYVSRRTGEGWTDPVRLPIPYGWGARLTHDGEDLVYTVDNGIARVPVVLLPMLGE